MEQELVVLFQTVKKAADAAANNGVVESSPEEERCLDALALLKNFPVNYQVLVSTQVGKQLRHLTKHPSKKIQSLAIEVVEIWKHVIVAETTRKKNECVDKSCVKTEPVAAETPQLKKVQKSNSLKVEKGWEIEAVKAEQCGRDGALNSRKMVKSESFPSGKKVENKSGVNPKKNTTEETLKLGKIMREDKQTSDTRNSAANPVCNPNLSSVVYCNDVMRDKIRELLSEALCKVSGEVDDGLKDEVNSCDPYRVAVSLESAMFEKWGKSNGAQKMKYRSIMFNIKDPKNPDFRRKVLLGYFKPERIPSLRADEMASDQRQKQNEKIKEKALFECERGQQSEATTDQFKCSRCGQRKCTYYQMQTRSADEPMTTYVTCVNCNNHWKFC